MLFPPVIGVFLVLAISLPVEIFDLPNASKCMLRDRDEVFLRSPERKVALKKSSTGISPAGRGDPWSRSLFFGETSHTCSWGIAVRSISVLFSVAISLHLSQTRSQ